MDMPAEFNASESIELLLLAEEIGRIGVIDWDVQPGVCLSPNALAMYRTRNASVAPLAGHTKDRDDHRSERLCFLMPSSESVARTQVPNHRFLPSGDVHVMALFEPCCARGKGDDDRVIRADHIEPRAAAR